MYFQAEISSIVVFYPSVFSKLKYSATDPTLPIFNTFPSVILQFYHPKLLFSKLNRRHFCEQ